MLCRGKQRDPGRPPFGKPDHAIVVINLILPFISIKLHQIDRKSISFAVVIGSHHFLLSWIVTIRSG